jgi:hypothetical protein
MVVLLCYVASYSIKTIQVKTHGLMQLVSYELHLWRHVLEITFPSSGQTYIYS